MRVVVCTVVHHPMDARILHRQIRALLDAGHQVSYIAPLRACGVAPWPGLAVAADVPRAVGRSRLAALRAARRELARLSPAADLLIVHDPELLLVLPLVGRRPPTVWDVHEDTAAALSTKAWLPGLLWPAMAAAVRVAERIAERKIHLILAEHSYAGRFRRSHPVVPNATYVPDHPAPPGRGDRVIYIGHLSPDRGTSEMIEVGRLLQPHGIAVELIGPADAQARAELARAQAAGLVRWHGFLPNDLALLMSEGALAGLSLLHDEPNFRYSLPTKVAEYMARAVPVITSPLPLAVGLVERYGCGTVVPFGDPGAAADAVLRLAADPGLRARQGRRGHRGAAESLGWPAHARPFVAQLEEWAAAPSRSAHASPATQTPPVAPPAPPAPPVQVPAPSPGRRP